MNDPQIHYIHLETTYLDESSQRELDAYRKLGSVKHLGWLKHKEQKRRERRLYWSRKLDELFGAVVLAGAIVLLITLGVILT